MEASFKIGYAYEQRGKVDQAMKSYQQIVDTYKQRLAQGRFADDYVAAEAQFRMGEIEWKCCTALRTVNDFVRSIEMVFHFFQSCVPTKIVAYKNFD